MVWQHARVAMLAGVLTATAAPFARAEQDKPAEPIQAPVAAPAAAPAAAPGPCAPLYRTVCVKEWVPETYQCTRTVYRPESRVETYTAYRCECVPEVRTRTVTVCRMVSEVQTITRKVCVSVPVTEERTVMQSHVSYRPVTKMVSRCVDRGHWECREVPCSPSWRERLRKLCRRGNDCCDPCEPCCPPPTKTVRVWVPCKVWEQVPVTCMERVCEQRPTVVRVTTCRHEWRDVQSQVTVCRSVPETRTENYTVHVRRSVPYQATRTVTVCVPSQETVTATRMVCRTVERQVPVDSGCGCDSGCDSCCGKPRHRMAGLSLRRNKGCCD